MGSEILHRVINSTNNVYLEQYPKFTLKPSSVIIWIDYLLNPVGRPECTYLSVIGLNVPTNSKTFLL